MKTTICFVRHGETEWNKTLRIQGRVNNQLAENGIIQAEDTAKYLRKNDPSWDIMLSSPLSRAYDTALILAKHLEYQQEIFIYEEVTERDFGEAEGLHLSKEVYNRMYAGDFKGIETTWDLQKRCKDVVLKIAKDLEGKKVLVTTHSHFIKGLFTQIDPNVFFTTSLSNGSLNYVSVENEIITSEKFNVNSHL